MVTVVAGSGTRTPSSGRACSRTPSSSRPRRMAERRFSPPEADWLKEPEEPEERMRVAAYFWLWTRKEAMGKAYGTGPDPTAFLLVAPTPPRWPAGREPAPPVASAAAGARAVGFLAVSARPCAAGRRRVGPRGRGSTGRRARLGAAVTPD
ncbi:4'-phosphopantetheinyl transferase superfamily protein [Streptomyces sp. NPDC059382]|uniref:4'-phosphopantetheinyl transferase superfamily protein n=1 Tax=Streptomyces sp. NPDC059382 TaxID=3346816 RepID=UPI0036C8EB06